MSFAFNKRTGHSMESGSEVADSRFSYLLVFLFHLTPILVTNST